MEKLWYHPLNCSNPGAAHPLHKHHYYSNTLLPLYNSNTNLPLCHNVRVQTLCSDFCGNEAISASFVWSSLKTMSDPLLDAVQYVGLWYMLYVMLALHSILQYLDSAATWTKILFVDDNSAFNTIDTATEQGLTD